MPAWVVWAIGAAVLITAVIGFSRVLAGSHADEPAREEH